MNVYALGATPAVPKEKRASVTKHLREILDQIDDGGELRSRVIAKRLYGWANQDEDPALSLAAIREILNRIDGKAPEFISHDVTVQKRIIFTGPNGEPFDPFAVTTQ
jgi:hypothetical protein